MLEVTTIILVNAIVVFDSQLWGWVHQPPKEESFITSHGWNVDEKLTCWRPHIRRIRIPGTSSTSFKDAHHVNFSFAVLESERVDHRPKRGYTHGLRILITLNLKHTHVPCWSRSKSYIRVARRRDASGHYITNPSKRHVLTVFGAVWMLEKSAFAASEGVPGGGYD